MSVGMMHRAVRSFCFKKNLSGLSPLQTPSWLQLLIFNETNPREEDGIASKLKKSVEDEIQYEAILY